MCAKHHGRSPAWSRLSLSEVRHRHRGLAPRTNEVASRRPCLDGDSAWTNPPACDRVPHPSAFRNLSFPAALWSPFLFPR